MLQVYRQVNIDTQSINRHKNIDTQGIQTDNINNPGIQIEISFQDPVISYINDQIPNQFYSRSDNQLYSKLDH